MTSMAELVVAFVDGMVERRELDDALLAARTAPPTSRRVM